MKKLVFALLMTTLFCTQARSEVEGDEFYVHNNSYMVVQQYESSVIIYYHEPRPGLDKAGVKVGTVLFSGTLAGNSLSGTAHVFKKGCIPMPYRVSGFIEGPLPSFIRLYGAAPNVRGCSIVGYSHNRNSELEFYPAYGEE